MLTEKLSKVSPRWLTKLSVEFDAELRETTVRQLKCIRLRFVADVQLSDCVDQLQRLFSHSAMPIGFTKMFPNFGLNI